MTVEGAIVEEAMMPGAELLAPLLPPEVVVDLVWVVYEEMYPLHRNDRSICV